MPSEATLWGSQARIEEWHQLSAPEWRARKARSWR